MAENAGERVYAGRLLLVGVILMAGCAGAAEAPDEGDGAPARSVTVSDGPASELGSIQGVIVDDEHVPIPNATAVILELGAGAVSSPDGSFFFDGVPPGQYAVSASKPGYAGEARRVNIVAGETAPVQFQLNPLAAAEPFHEAFSHVAMHHFGVYATNVVTAYYYDESLLCEGCNWLLNLSGSPEMILIEMWGNHTVPDASGANRELLFVDNVTTGNRMSSHVVELPYGRGELNQSKLKGASSFYVRILCDPGPIGVAGWPCIEERRDLWLTAFYFMTMPAGYSAKGGGT